MNLKKLRLENNKTQDQIAKILNVAHGTYNGYEQGKFEPNIDSLKALADYYNVSLD